VCHGGGLEAKAGSQWSRGATARARRHAAGPGKTHRRPRRGDRRELTREVRNLDKTQLRKLRSYERAHANRKPVLAAIDKALG
jgi:hypothetical protein